MRRRFSKKEKIAFAIGCRIGMNNSRKKKYKTSKASDSRRSYIASLKRKMAVGQNLSFSDQAFIENNSHLF